MWRVFQESPLVVERHCLVHRAYVLRRVTLDVFHVTKEPYDACVL